MKLSEFIDTINAEILTNSSDPQSVEISGGCVSDLLSDVMGSSEEGQLWITIMRHLNTVAVASMIGIPAIIFAKNIKPDPQVIDKANQEGVCLISSHLSTFQLAGKLYQKLYLD